VITVNERDSLPWREGITVQRLLDAMGWDYPLLVVTVNGVTVDPEDYGRAPVPDGADVRVLHIAHGG